MLEEAAAITILTKMLEEAAAIPLPVLPEELIGEILLRLSVRSLLQFKCVCKSWKILISGSHFIKSHVRISTSDPTILSNQQLVFSSRKQPREIVSNPLKPLFKNPSTPVKYGTFGCSEESFYRIIGSCNGLLCVIDGFPFRVRLCNPSLRFISKNSSAAHVSQDWFLINYGFGYDQVNDKYKALLVVRCKINDYQILTKLYTFGQDDSWKTIPNSPYAYDHLMYIGKFVSGTLNWIVSCKNTIISFDIEKETYMKMLLPQNNSDNDACTYRALSVLSDCLCVSEYDSKKFHFVVWMMKEYGVVESWTKFMVIPTEKFIRNQPCLIHPFFVSENGVLMVIIGSELILYNSNTGVALNPLITMELGRDPHIYCESLVSLPCYW